MAPLFFWLKRRVAFQFLLESVAAIGKRILAKRNGLLIIAIELRRH